MFPKRKTLLDVIVNPSSEAEDPSSLNFGKILAEIAVERLEEKQQLTLEIDGSFKIKNF